MLIRMRRLFVCVCLTLCVCVCVTRLKQMPVQSMLSSKEVESDISDASLRKSHSFAGLQGQVTFAPSSTTASPEVASGQLFFPLQCFVSESLSFFSVHLTSCVWMLPDGLFMMSVFSPVHAGILFFRCLYSKIVCSMMVTKQNLF